MRRELQVAMLTDVLAACAGAHRLAGVLVVTSDPDARALAERIAGARVVPDHDPPRGMNAAVVAGLAAVAAAGAEAALVLTADLPAAPARGHRRDPGRRLRRALGGARALPRRDRDQRDAAAPARGAVARGSGPDSLARHRAQATRRGLALARLELPRASRLDIDTPRDLAALMAAGGDRRDPRGLRAARGVAELLEAGSAL